MFFLEIENQNTINTYTQHDSGSAAYRRKTVPFATGRSLERVQQLIALRLAARCNKKIGQTQHDWRKILVLHTYRPDCQPFV